MRIKLKRILNLWYIFIPISLGLIATSFIFKQNRDVQIRIVVLALFIYISFSLIHHYYDKSLTFETILEYILIATLVLIILAGAFF